MAMSNENRFAPPSAAVADVVAETSGLALATRSRRLGASLLDGLINGALYFLVQFLLGRPIFPGAAGAGMANLAINVVIGITISLLLNGWLLIDRGQTVGKILVGLRIVRPDGSKVGVGRIVARYVFQHWIPLIPILGGIVGLVDVLMIFRQSRRCLHDEIADTVVIRI